VVCEGLEERRVLDRVGGDQPIDLLACRDRLIDDALEAFTKAFRDDVEMPARRLCLSGDPRLE
jgi:hypothetical protein